MKLTSHFVSPIFGFMTFPCKFSKHICLDEDNFLIENENVVLGFIALVISFIFLLFFLSHNPINSRCDLLIPPSSNTKNNNKKTPTTKIKQPKKIMLWFLTHFPSNDAWGQRLFLLFYYLAISSFMEVSINLSFTLIFSPSSYCAHWTMWW